MVGRWPYPAESDRTEAEHVVELIGGRLYCTCTGFVVHKHCKHVDDVKEKEHMEDNMTALAVSVPQSPALARQNPAALAVRLQDMKENRRLTREFFASVMEEGTDYGVIPGTEKPTLFKPGAEGLCELYGYAPTYTVDETKDLNTGFLRVVVTCTLVQRGSNEVVAQGLGECNTREARYFYRWMPEWEMKKFPELWNVRESYKKEERKWKDKKTGQQKSAVFYRTENDDLFTLWNTVLKMAKKRAHVDATLSATRSSGLFSQGAAALEDWIEGEFEDVTDGPAPAPPSQPEPVQQDEMTVAYMDLVRERGADAGKAVMDWAEAAFPHAKSSKGKFDRSKLAPAEVAAVFEEMRRYARTGTARCAEGEHEGQYNEDTTLLSCSICGLLLEQPEPVAQGLPM